MTTTYKFFVYADSGAEPELLDEFSKLSEAKSYIAKEAPGDLYVIKAIDQDHAFKRAQRGY